MILVQQHRNGYYAPFIFMNEQTLIERLKNKSLLCSRFPNVWSFRFIK